MNPLANTPEDSSARLEELLSKSGGFKEKGHGLTEQLKILTGVSYTTARKWLYEDSVPRTSEERIRVAKTLNIDLLYWEYGYNSAQDKVAPFKDDYLFHMKVANEVMSIIHTGKIDILPDKVISIEIVALDIARITGNSEPDTNLLKSLIKLAT